jgi:hypothetical protein
VDFFNKGLLQKKGKKNLHRKNFPQVRVKNFEEKVKNIEQEIFKSLILDCSNKEISRKLRLSRK